VPRASYFVYRVSCFVFRVSGFVFRVSGFMFRVSSLGSNHKVGEVFQLLGFGMSYGL
jgi:hypothetical protein